jgi:hypothetical protein
MGYYEREEAYQALFGDNPDISAIIGKLNPDDCRKLQKRLGREVPPLQARLKVLNSAMLKAARKIGQ